MTCSDARPHLSALLDSAGEAGDREATARHVGSCPSCRAELDTLSAADRALKGALADAAERSAPPGYFDDFWSRVAASLDEKPVTDTGHHVAAPSTGDAEIDDLRMLAAATIRRSSEITVPQLPLTMMSSTSLSQVVLPMASPSSAATSLADVGAEPPRARRGRLGVIFGAAATVAVGAVAVVLLINRGGERPAPLPPPIVEQMAANNVAPTVAPLPPPPVVEPMTAPASEPSLAAGDNPVGAAGSPSSEPTAVVAANPSSAPSAPASPVPAATPPAAVVVPAAPPSERVPAASEKVAEKSPDKALEKPADKTPDAAAGPKHVAAAAPARSDSRPDATKPEMKADPVPDVVKPDPAKPDAPKDAPKKDEVAKAADPAAPGPSVGAPGAPATPDAKKKVDLPSAEALLKEVNAPPTPPPEGGGAPGKPAEPSGPRHERLSQEEISAGMESVASDAQACSAKATETAMVTVSMKIKPDGSVADASPTGKFAGTDVGACVAGVAKHAKFVSFDGAAMTIRYGFRVEKQEE